jgi:hypothetical protein
MPEKKQVNTEFGPRISLQMDFRGKGCIVRFDKPKSNKLDFASIISRKFFRKD